MNTPQSSLNGLPLIVGLGGCLSDQRLVGNRACQLNAYRKSSVKINTRTAARSEPMLVFKEEVECSKAGPVSGHT